MDYQESRRFRRRDNLIMNLTGVDKIDVPKLVDVIINLQDRVQELEYELKNIKYDMKVKQVLPNLNGSKN